MAAKGTTKQIAIIGAGRVGLVVAACLADKGFSVTCMDKDRVRIQRLRRGRVPFYEPGLEKMIRKNIRLARLRFSDDLLESLRSTSLAFLTVGTEGPDGLISTGALFEIIEQVISADLKKLLIIKSTVPVGTAEQLSRKVFEKHGEKSGIVIVSNPEFLSEGSAISDFLDPQRIIIGTQDKAAARILQKIYQVLYSSKIPVVLTNNKTAELIKLGANSFLATKLSFVNELANLCDLLDCDIHSVTLALGHDSRIGTGFLNPGPGYGGSCLPKDARTLYRLSAEGGAPMSVLGAAIQTNEAQPRRIVAKIRERLGPLKGQILAILGLTYKPETDDVRESPAIQVCELLLQEGAIVRAYDPRANASAQRYPKGTAICFCKDPWETCQGARCLVILTT